jgi:hypothetical protein
VTAEERERLQEWARRPKTAQALALRSRIVLECAAGQPNVVVAASWELRTRPLANGASALWSSGLTVCSTNRGPVRRAKSVMHRSSG